MSFFVSENGEIINQKDLDEILDELKIWMHMEGDKLSLGEEQLHYNSYGELKGYGRTVMFNNNNLTYEGIWGTYNFIWLTRAFKYSLCIVKLRHISDCFRIMTGELDIPKPKEPYYAFTPSN